MKTAIIGTSWITEKFISAAEKTEKYTFEAVCSRTAEKGTAFAQKYGIKKLYTSAEALAADKSVESVYIASPNVCHYPQSKYLLLHGKNVICEKPASTKESEMAELTEIAEKNGLVYTEAIMSMYVPAFDRLKETLTEIGSIKTCNFVFCQLSSKYPAYVRGENPNIFNPRLHTGCLADIGVYNVFLSAGLFGMPQRIVSHSSFLESGADGFGTAILDYGDKTVNLVYSKVGQSYSPSEIIGDNGTVSVASVSQLTGIKVIRDGKTQITVPHDLSRDEVMGAEASVFADAVNGNADAVKKVNEVNGVALTVRRICDVIRKQNGFPF